MDDETRRHRWELYNSDAFIEGLFWGAFAVSILAAALIVALESF